MTIFNSNLFVYQRVAWTKRMVVQLLKIPILLDCEVGSLWGTCLLESLHVSAKKKRFAAHRTSPFFQAPTLVALMCHILFLRRRYVAWRVTTCCLDKHPGDWQIALANCHEMPWDAMRCHNLLHIGDAGLEIGAVGGSPKKCSLLGCSLFGRLPPLNFDGFSCEG
jgi:hypothetical protein